MLNLRLCYWSNQLCDLRVVSSTAVPVLWLNQLNILLEHILRDPGTDSGGEGKSKRAEKYGTKKSKERREEPLGTMSYQTSSKRSPPFCLLIGQKNTQKFSGTNQKSEWRRPFGIGPFRLSLVSTICPWVSEDG